MIEHFTKLNFGISFKEKRIYFLKKKPTNYHQYRNHFGNNHLQQQTTNQNNSINQKQKEISKKEKVFSSLLHSRVSYYIFHNVIKCSWKESEIGIHGINERVKHAISWYKLCGQIEKNGTVIQSLWQPKRDNDIKNVVFFVR